jgi:hypothetical protein
MNALYLGFDAYSLSDFMARINVQNLACNGSSLSGLIHRLDLISLRVRGETSGDFRGPELIASLNEMNSSY